jgi:hypothetical protein
MTDWLAGMWPALDLSGPGLFWFLLISALASAGGLFAVGLWLVNMPAAYFCERPAADCPLRGRRGVHWWAGRIAKGLLGGAIIILGAVMAVPGVPGPGLLTVLVGITLTDFPGKRRLERWVVSRPGVLPAINLLRSRRRKPPMFLEETAGIGGR